MQKYNVILKRLKKPYLKLKLCSMWQNPFEEKKSKKTLKKMFKN